MPKEAREIATRIKVDGRELRQEFRRGASEAQKFQQQMVNASTRIKRAWSDMGFGRAASRARSLISTVGSIAGAYGFAEGIRRTREFEETLGDLTIQGGKANSWMEGARGKILKTASDWGHMKDDVMSFVTTLVGFTGEADPALAKLKDMGMVATSTGADFRALGGMVFQMQQNLGIASTSGQVKAMAMLRAMEKVGTYQFKYYAQYGGRVFPMMSQFGVAGRGMAGTRAAGGLMQLAARGFGAGEEAQTATATATFLRMLFLKRGEVQKKLGVQVMDRDLRGVFKDLGRVMQDNKKATEALKIFAEGGRVAQQLGIAYRGGWQKEAGKIFGVKADEDRLRRDAKQKMDQPAQKWKRVMADFDASVHQHLLPVMRQIVQIMPSVAKGFKWAMENIRLLIRTWAMFKASGMIHGLIGFIQKLKTVGGGPGGVPHLGGPQVTPGGRAPGTAMSVLGSIPLMADVAMFGVNAIEWMNRLKGGPQIGVAPGEAASPFESDWWKKGLGLSGETEEALKGERKKAERLQGENVANMLANLGIQPRSKSMEKIELAEKMKQPKFIKEQRETLQRLRERRAQFVEAGGAKGSKEQQATLARLDATIEKLSKTLAAFDQKKLSVTVKAPDGAEGRSTQRSGVSRPAAAG